MTTTTSRRSLNRGVARAASLCLLALAAVLLQGREARAQWSAPDASGNVSSTNTGNVGVGTSTPAAKVHVQSDSTYNNEASPALILGSKSNPTYRLLGGYDLAANAAFLQSLQSGLGYRTLGINPNGGFVGVGTVAPAAPLEVKGLTNGATLFRLFDASINGTTSAPKIVFNAGGTDIANIKANYNGGTFRLDLGATAGAQAVSILNSGNVGFGTTTPLAPIHVATGTASGGAAFFQKDATSGGVGVGTYNGLGAISGVNFNYTGAADLLVNPTGGNVGIGTLTPASKLHVAGNITVDGNINAKYQDVAEWVPTTQKLQAGTVVVLDTKRGNHVNASTRAYDTRVAGVVSAQPGITLGEAGEGKALVATTGRVKVRVDATSAPIEIGDLIVTSDVEGVAMKSVEVDLGGVKIHRPGTIIGKALESFDKGTGEILVLLSLQ